MSIELATAYVSIVADTKGLGKDITRDLSNSGGRAGDKAGADFASSFVSKSKGIKGSVSKEMDGASAAGKSAGGGMGDAFMGGFGGKIGGLSAAGGPIGAALGGVTAVGLAAGALLGKAVMDGMGQLQQRDLVQAKLGFTDDQMGQIGTAAGDAFGNAWGTSVQGNIETAREAIRGGLLNEDATTGEVQRVIESLTGLADVMETDIGAAAKTAGQLIRTGLAKDGTEAFDLLTKGAQKVELESGDIADTFSQSSATLKQFGLDGKQSLGMFKQAIDAGAPSADFLVGALEELAGNAGDSADVFAELGLNGQEMAQKLTGGGEGAAQGLDMLLDKLRQIEDPAQRTNAFVKLFGEEATAMQEAILAVDPSNAVRGLGNLAGAAQRANDTISDNPMAQLQGSMNTLSVEADKLKVSLAGAFAPMAQDLSGWVTEHQPEIIGFFTGLGSAALTTTDIILGFTSGSLRGWAMFADGVAQATTGILDAMAGIVGAQADVLDLIPGMGGQADDFRGIADSISGFSNGIRTAGDNARGMADVIDNTLRPGIQNARTDLNTAGQQAQDTAIMMRALGQAIITDIPDGKSVVIESNSPQQRAELEALGLKVTQLPNGSFKVESNTAEGQAQLDNFIAANSGRVVGIKLSVDEIINRYGVGSQNAIRAGFLGGRDPGFANGGLFRGKGGPTADANTIRISDREFITQASSVNSGTLPWLEAINAGWVPPADLLHGMIPGFATGGLFDRDAATGKAKAHNGEPYVYGALDCSGYLSAVFNAGTGAGVRFVTGSDFASMGWAPGYDPNGFSIGTNGGVGENGHMAGTLYGVNVESDGSNGIQYGGSADGAQDFPMVWHWPGASAGDDPSTERLTDSGLDTSMLGGGGTGGAPVTGGGGGGGAGGFSGGGGSGGSGGASTSGSTPVFVTNWPGGNVTPSADSTNPTAVETAPADALADIEQKKLDEQVAQHKKNQELSDKFSKIGTDAALEILGVEGTLLDPGHRFWQTARDYQAASSSMAETVPPAQQSTQFPVIVNNPTFADGQKMIRDAIELQKRQAMRYAGRP